MSPLYAPAKSTDLEMYSSALGTGGTNRTVVETVFEILLPVTGSRVEPVIEAVL
jgi:hypothetical protein